MSSAIYREDVDVETRKPSTHPHITIRNRVMKMLQALVPEMKDKIFISREMALKAEAYPQILIFTEGASLQSMLSNNPAQERRQVELVISLGIVGSAVDDAGLQDRIDEFTFPVEQMLIDNHTLGDIVEDVIYSSSDMSIDSDGEGVFFHTRLRYNVIYYREENPLIGGHAFLIGGVEYEIDDSNDFVEMTDEIDLPEESEAAA